jgi:hypothetical protein
VRDAIAPPANHTEAPDMSESTTPEAAEATAYTIGYRKPPLHTRFRKGQSGNPAGRPRRSARPCAKELTLAEVYRAVVVKEDRDGRAEPVPALQAILRSQVALAIKGNGPAQRAVLAAVNAIEDREDMERRVAEQTAAIIAYRRSQNAP